jgi:hypothetical protein
MRTSERVPLNDVAMEFAICTFVVCGVISCVVASIMGQDPMSTSERGLKAK